MSLNVEPPSREAEVAAVDALRAEFETRGVLVKESHWGYRVLVIEGGRLLEHGTPSELAARPESHYAAMLRAEREVQEGLWSSGDWRHLRLEDGRICVRACAAESLS